MPTDKRDRRHSAPPDIHGESSCVLLQRLNVVFTVGSSPLFVRSYLIVHPTLSAVGSTRSRVDRHVQGQVSSVVFSHLHRTRSEHRGVASSLERELGCCAIQGERSLL